ncbi:MAG: biotin synthase BioB, partial [Actinomycetota bacterium]|nr:biotin synthase BioB [Actinomycetota bacterium]
MSVALDRTAQPSDNRADIVATARQQVLEQGVGLSEAQLVQVLRLPDGRLSELLELAHQVRMAWCGPEVEVEGIVSLKTGGCPEDCHFCSQSGQFTSPVRAVWLNIPELVEAAVQTAATGATEFCIVAAVRGPDERLMGQVRDGVAAIRAAVDINVACSLGMLTQTQVDELAAMGVHRYNHNLEAARSYFGS